MKSAPKSHFFQGGVRFGVCCEGLERFKRKCVKNEPGRGLPLTVAICVEPWQRCATYSEVDLDTFHDFVADGIPSDDVDHHLAVELIARFPLMENRTSTSSRTSASCDTPLSLDFPKAARLRARAPWTPGTHLKIHQSFFTFLCAIQVYPPHINALF